MNEYIGSNFDDFLDEEGIIQEVEAAAIKKVVACLVKRSMDEAQITKVEMARRMGTSRVQLDRLLNPDNPAVTLTTLVKAANAVGKKISISFDNLDSTATA
jgi:plasmid maintenance system antidote protein VapI